MAPMIGGNHRRPGTVGQPCKPPFGSSRSSPSLFGLAACAAPAASPSAAPPAGPLVTVETRGGECPAGACGQTITIDRDGRVHLAAKPPNDLGTVTPEVLSTLQTLIATTDFAAIKSRPFTGDCPDRL